MSLSVNWTTRVVTIPKADLTLLTASPEVRELDLDWFRLRIRELESSEAGIIFAEEVTIPDGIVENTEPLTIAGVTLARVIRVINGFTIEFENAQYAVNVVGGNSNIADVKVVNQVSVNTSNSAGLIQSSGGGGSGDWTTLEKQQIRYRLGLDGAANTPSASPQLAAAVWQQIAEQNGADTITYEESIRVLMAISAGKTTIVPMGGGVAIVTFRSILDEKDRVIGETLGRARTDITLDLT